MNMANVQLKNNHLFAPGMHKALIDNKFGEIQGKYAGALHA